MNFLIAIENKYINQYITKLITDRNDHLLAFPYNQVLFTGWIDEYKPDWIIIDLSLKKVNGFDLAEKIRKRSPELKICLLSDFIDERLIKKGNLIGADAFISKENLFEFYKALNKDK